MFSRTITRYSTRNNFKPSLKSSTSNTTTSQYQPLSFPNTISQSFTTRHYTTRQLYQKVELQNHPITSSLQHSTWSKSSSQFLLPHSSFTTTQNSLSRQYPTLATSKSSQRRCFASKPIGMTMLSRKKPTFTLSHHKSTKSTKHFSSTPPQRTPIIPPIPEDIFKSSVASLNKIPNKREIIVPTMAEYAEGPSTSTAQAIPNKFFSQKTFFQYTSKLAGFSLKAGLLVAGLIGARESYALSPDMFFLNCYEGNYKDFAYEHGLKELFYSAFPEELITDGLKQPQDDPEGDISTNKIPLALPLVRIERKKESGIEINAIVPLVSNYQSLIIRQSFEWLRLRTKVRQTVTRINQALDLLDDVETAALRSSLKEQTLNKINSSPSSLSNLTPQQQLSIHYAREALVALRDKLKAGPSSSERFIANVLFDYGRYDLSKPIPFFQISSPFSYFSLPNKDRLTDHTTMSNTLERIGQLSIETQTLLQSARLAILYAQSIIDKEWVQTTPDYLQSLPNLVQLFGQLDSLPVQLQTSEKAQSQGDNDAKNIVNNVVWPVDINSLNNNTPSLASVPNTTTPYAFDYTNQEVASLPCAVITAWCSETPTNSTSISSLLNQPQPIEPPINIHHNPDLMSMNELSISPPLKTELIDISSLTKSIPQSIIIDALNKHHGYHNSSDTLVFKTALNSRIAVPVGVRKKYFKGWNSTQLPPLDPTATQLAIDYMLRESKSSAATIEVGMAKRQQEIEEKIAREGRQILPSWEKERLQKQKEAKRTNVTKNATNQVKTQMQLLDQRLTKLQLDNPQNIPFVFRTAVEGGQNEQNDQNDSNDNNDQQLPVLNGSELTKASTRLYDQFETDRSDIEAFLITLQPGDVLLIEVSPDGFVFDATDTYKHQRGDLTLN